MYQVRFLDENPEMEVNSQDTPAFYQLYQQAVLICLREQGVLTQDQFSWCVERLEAGAGNKARVQ